MNLPEIAKKVIQKAKRLGADQAEVFIQVSRSSDCRVREGQIEELTQATSKGLGLRIISGQRLGFAYTTDFTPNSLDRSIREAIALAGSSAKNALNNLPVRDDLKRRNQLTDLADEKIESLPEEWKIQAALEAEKAGKSFDPRIKTFDSVGAGENVTEVCLASSEGLADTYKSTSIYLYAAPVAAEGDQLQTSHWMDYKRFKDDLESPESIGIEASKRAVRMLGAKKVKSQKVPVIFDPQIAASFIGSLASAANGDSVFKQSSFLASLRGETIAPASFSVVDDGLLPRGVGTSPFDGEGVPTRRTAIVEKGILKNFLYDTFTARKAKVQTTGNAQRGYSSLPSIGIHNLYLERGDQKPEEMIRSIKNGFYVTAMLGRGANVVTGDYSRGANGIWIENGELAYPVQEVTVAGNLLEMLKRIDAIGNDLEFRGSVNAPSLRFSELTVSGA